jgi:hypothetical protein
MDTLYNASRTYWGGAIVAWDKQNSPKPELSLVSLSMGDIKTATFPDEIVDDFGEVHHQYPSTVVWEVNLYTNGRVANPDLDYSERINTAVNDLTEFVKYLKSPGLEKFYKDHNISILQKTDVRDVSIVVNDSSYEYRAMVEFDINFVSETVGTGGNKVTTDSGGGGTSDTSGDNGWFNKVNITREGGN